MLEKANTNDGPAAILDSPLNPSLIQERRGGGNATYEYISGSTIIDQANRIFGYGNWTFEHETPEPFYDVDEKLVAYTCKAKIIVGNVTITDEGSSRVTWPNDGRNPTVDNLTMARKGSITDAKRRCFRNFGSQFGNDLYNDNDFRKSVANHVVQRLTQPALGYERARAVQIVTRGYNGDLGQVPINRSISILTQAIEAAREERARKEREKQEGENTAPTVEGTATAPADNSAAAPAEPAVRPDDPDENHFDVPEDLENNNPAAREPAGAAANSAAERPAGRTAPAAAQQAPRNSQRTSGPGNQGTSRPSGERDQGDAQPAAGNQRRGRPAGQRQPPPREAGRNRSAAAPSATAADPQHGVNPGASEDPDYMDTPEMDPFS